MMSVNPFKRKIIPSVVMKEGTPTATVINSVDESDERAGQQADDHSEPDRQIVVVIREIEDPGGERVDLPG